MSTARRDDSIRKAVLVWLRENGKLDAYDERIAALTGFDLLFGPLTLDDGVEDVDFVRLHKDGFVDSEARFNYSKAVDHLNDLDLPSDLYIDEDSDCVMESEPEAEFYEGEDDEEGGYVDPPPYYHYDYKQVRAAAFGTTVANEI